MRVMVYGVGGVGGYYGGRLAQSGVDVAFIARGEHLRALRRDGLHVASVAGDFDLRNIEVTDDPAEVGKVDYVLLGLKAWQVKEAAERIRPNLGADTAVVTLQNGVEAPYVVADVVGRERVMPGSVRILSFVEAPGRIRHVGGPANIVFGEWDDEPSARSDRLGDALRAAGIAVEESADILAALWRKFIFVVPMGAVGAVSRAPIGVARELPETRALLEEAVSEIWRVARAREVAVPRDLVAGTMAALDSLPPAGTSSLQRDIAAGRPSELEDWVGAVVRLGDEAGVDVPLHRTIYRALVPLERRARGEVAFPD